MNYLGHATISGNDDNILIGNMLGDFIKGKDYNNYPEQIAKGIQYHRQIDSFTDNHESIRASTKILREDGIKYAGVFIDIFFDYFLANDERFYPTHDNLKEFTLSVLAKMDSAQDMMNERMKTYFGYMIRYNWLYHYHSKTGIEKSILGLVKRHPKLGDGNQILFSLFNNIELLRPHYHNFISDISDWSKEQLSEIS